MQIRNNVIYGVFKPNIQSQVKQALDKAGINSEPTKSLKTIIEASENNKSALKTFNKSINEAAELKKARARARLEDIRKQIDALKKLYGSDPKRLAKAMAHLTKELKAIVKEYKSAKTDNKDFNDADIKNIDSNKTDSNKTDTKDADVKETAPETSLENIESVKPEASVAIDDSELKRNEAKFENFNLQDYKTNNSEDKPVSLIDKYAKALLSNEDKDFIDQVKGLKAEIKKIFDLAKLKLSAKPSKENEEIFKEFKEASEELDKEIKGLEKMAIDDAISSNDASSYSSDASSFSSDISSGPGQIISITA